MFTDVVKGGELAVTVANTNHALSLDTAADVIAGLTQFFLVAQKLPAAMEDLLAFDVEKFRLGVTARVDRVRTQRVVVVSTSELDKFFTA